VEEVSALLSMAQGANGVVGWLLRSSFSGLLERSLLLLDVRGRRSGRHYRLPVQYAQAGPVIWVLPAGHERKRWWRNLVQEQPVQLWLYGQQRSGRAWAVNGATDLTLALDGLRVYLRRFPSMARRSGITRPDGTIDQDRLRELAARTIIVRILPDEEGWTAARPALHAEDGEPERGRGVVAAVRRHPLGAFYLLTFALSWAYWVPDVLAGGHRSHFPGLLGPAIAAIVITGLTRGRAGLRDLGSRMLRWRVPARWYLAAAAPLLVAVVAAAILQLTGVGFPGWAAFGQMPGLPDLGVAGVVAGTLLINGLGEETGWRGLALPGFRRWHAKLQASVLVAIPWVLWHLPTFFLDSGYRGTLNPLVLPGFIFGIFAGSIVLTWLYEGAGCSVLLVALWHTSFNLGSATRAGEGVIAPLVTVFVVVSAFVIARGWRRSDQLRPGSSTVPLSAR
jgi:membrane protease YdiL (CAAX protease family)